MSVKYLILAAALAGSAVASAAEFSVVSIRPSAEEVQFEHDGKTTTTPGNLVMRDVLVATCLEWAYNIQEKQISGPEWIGSEHFDIVAKADHPASDDEMKQMMKTLLQQRFGLSFHLQKKELSSYLMTVAKGGHKMKEAAPDEKPERQNTAISTIAKAMTMREFGDFLSQPLRMPVVDQTGLTGRYDFVLDFTRYLPTGEKAMTPDFDNNNGIIMAALQGELGLKLEGHKEVVDVYVIDHVERPSTN